MKIMSGLLDRPRHSRAGFSLVEVLTAMLILVIGVAGITGLLMSTMRHSRRAMDQSIAAYLAQRKAEEIRRDDTLFRDMIAQIEALATPTAPVDFPLDPRFSYSYCGVSLLDPLDDPGNAADDANVARIVIRYAASYRADQDILYELRFDD